jgi:hypothetical protein
MSINDGDTFSGFISLGGDRMSSFFINDLNFFQSVEGFGKNGIKGGIDLSLAPAALPAQISGIRGLPGVTLRPGVTISLQPGTSIIVSSAATSSSSGYGIRAMATAATTAREGGISYYLSTSISS